MFQEQIKPITAELGKILSRGYNSHDVFEDWLDLMIYALTGNDEEYLKIVHRYRNEEPMGRREIDYFKNAFHLLLNGMAEKNEELLGEIYMTWNMGNKYTGQFFTPSHIAKLIAEITMPKSETVYDPCCGAGVMLVQGAKAMTKAECDKAMFYGKDIDLTCVKMCALNMTFFNLNSQIECGDSLLLERPYKVYRTVRSYLGGSIVEMDPQKMKLPQPEIPDNLSSRPFIPMRKDNFNQMSLFN